MRPENGLHTTFSRMSRLNTDSSEKRWKAGTPCPFDKSPSISAEDAHSGAGTLCGDVGSTFLESVHQRRRFATNCCTLYGLFVVVFH